MREVGAFEAKNRFSALLADVMAGEEVTITHRGRPVARLVPTGDRQGAAAVAAAVERLRARRGSVDLPGGFDWEEWKRYRDEGRR